MRSSYLVICCLFGVLSCGQAEVAQPYDRQALLSSLASGLMLPAYERLDAELGALETQLNKMCQDETVSQQELETSRQAWWSARAALEASAAFQIGPWRTMELSAFLERWPTDASTLNRLAAHTSSEALDATLLTTLGANKRGLPAIELLLWDTEADAWDSAPRRCQLVTLLASDARAKSSALLAAWTTPMDAAFLQDISRPDERRGAYKDSQAALSELANHASAAIEVIPATSLSKPLGTSRTGPRPDLAEAWRSERSLEIAKLNLASARALYEGEGSRIGLSDMVAARRPSIDESVREAFEAAAAALDAIEQPLERAVTQDRASVERAVEAHMTLLRLWRAEVLSTLGVSLAFSDNDGD